MPEGIIDTTDWLDKIFIKAIDNHASDIHFEPERDGLNVRIRVDGLLRQIEVLDKYSQDTIISKIKVMSKIDITDHRFPQDGHFEFNYGERIYNVRVSTLPTIYGEAIVMRILNREDILMKLDFLGFSEKQLPYVNKLLFTVSGMVLITGPTGSGKTNLLYSIIHKLSTPEKNTVTLEDPIEYQMSNIRQTQINDGIGLTFAKALRSVIRQDPDIIMLGEIRDVDTALMAIQAALTGILVFCTFHTFDVPALVTRFLEFGISNSIIAQSVKGVISTRLVRKICDQCKKPYSLDESKTIDVYTKKIMDQQQIPVSLRKGKGCLKCSNTGYYGRTGIYEVIYFDDDLKTSIIEQKPASYIQNLIVSKKAMNLKESAMEKVFQGITTTEEVFRVLGSDIL